MDINQLLCGVDCACGKKHTCAIESVYIEQNALQKLSEICRDEQHILLVADENTFAAAGEKICSVNDNGEIVLTLYNERVVNLFDRYRDLAYDQAHCINYQYDANTGTVTSIPL